jgi:hypothetical protein
VDQELLEMLEYEVGKTSVSPEAEENIGNKTNTYNEVRKCPEFNYNMLKHIHIQPFFIL